MSVPKFPQKSQSANENQNSKVRFRKHMMNEYETFGRRVLDILVDRCDWDGEAVMEIANLAEGMGLATGAANGEFEVT
jgi:hypothetical protein